MMYRRFSALRMDSQVRYRCGGCRRGVYRHRLGRRLLPVRSLTEACAGLATPSTVCAEVVLLRLRQVRQLPESPLASADIFRRFKALLNSATKYRCWPFSGKSRAILLVDAGLNALR